MAGVERISENIADGVHAGAIVSTMSKAVQELVSNSIDSGASSVEVKLDLPSYRLSVADNGRGIPKEKLQSLVATARATSKASSTEEMQHAPTYGFRGEALHSLGLTSLLEIQSRCAGKEPHAKVVREGQTLHFGPARSPVRTGTVVTLRDAFFKWPVRRRAANDVAEMARIKDYVSRIALVNNGVAFSVHDSAKGQVLLKTAATGNVVKTFAQVFSSDKLTSARKLVFNFKQFRITGYLSPPSSTACHWSKEFQFVYVNCRSVRRLDFVQRTINAAFAPCLALLCGRGGADGQQQGVVRKARNHNASSGQRQELFPAFVLNVECPRSEVDVMVDPEKTWVEFSDWTAARNACVAMLLAFLPHFPHAVPGSVLRDLRRVFHKNEGGGGGGEGWTQASPPSAPRRQRASPEITPAPSPSPPPMQLAVPDVGLPSPNDSGFGSPQGVGPGGENGCAWMGRERRAPGRMGGDGGEAMEFQDYGIRAEGVLYPSPASCFGARDNGGLSSHSVATTGYPPFDEPVDGFCRSSAGSGGAGGHAVDGTATVSSHFASLGQGRDGFDEGDYRHHRQRRCYLDDVDTTDAYNGGGDGHPIGSPHFSRSRGGGGRSDRESGRPRRLALEEHPLDEVNHGGGRRRSEEDRGVYEPPAALDSGDALPPSCESCHGPGEWTEATDWENGGGGGGGGGNKGGARTADRARALEVGDAGDSRGSWAAGRPGLRSEALERKGAALPPPRRRSPPLEPVPSLENAAREPDCDRAGTGEGSRVGGRRQRRREDRRSGRGSPPVPSREDPSGSWLRQLPGAAEEVLTGGHGDRGEAWAGEGGNALSLSRLFDYAFADDDRHRGWLPEQVGGPGGMGGSGGGRSGARAGFQPRLGGAASGGSRGIGSDRSLSPRLAPNSPAMTGGGSGGPVKKPLVGVTVRRPPSPQFSFMQEACLPAGDGGGGKGAACGVSPGPPAALSVRPTDPLEGGRQDMQAMSVSDFDVRYGPGDAQQQEQQEQRRQQRGQRRELASPIRSPLRRMDRPCDEDIGESPTAWEPPLTANDTLSCFSPRRRRADRSPPQSGDPGRWTNSSLELAAEAGRSPSHPRKRRHPVAWGLRGAAAPTAEPPLLPHGNGAGDVQEGSPKAEGRRRPASTAGPCANGRQDVGDDEEGGSGSGDGWLAWGAHGRGDSPSCPRSGGWWGQKGDDGCPLSDDRSPGAPAAIAAPTGRGASSGPLEADNSGHLTGAVGVREALGADGASGRRRDREAQQGHGGGPRAALPPEEEQQACAEEDAARPPETEISRRSGEISRPTPEGGENEEVCVSTGGGDGPVSDGGAGVRDRTRAADAALAYDQDVLGGDGYGSLEPTTIQGVLEKFLAPAEEGANDDEEEECDSCHVSDAGGAAVYSPRGPGGGHARKPSSRAERVSGPVALAASATAVSAAAGPYAPSSRTRERPISEVLQAGRDEIGAGAGAVAVTVTPEELGQACLIGQAGRKFVILRAKTGAILCVDQHAADERVKLEELERQVYGPERDRRNVEKLPLDPPEKLSVTQSDADLLEEHRQVLVSWNFEIEIEGGGQHSGGATAPIEALLLAVPVVCGVRLSVQDLSAFLHYLRESVEPGSSAGLLKPPQVQHILNYKACHSAIRFGDLLSRSECADLIRKLAACAFPFCCAHGRPSVVPLCVLGGAAPSSRASLGGGSGGGSLWAAGGKRKR